MKTKFLWMLIPAMMLGACDDNTSNLGIFESGDLITTSNTIVQMQSTTILSDSIQVTGSNCYWGKVTDKETKTSIKAEFLTQFHTMENYKLPAKEQMISDENGNIKIDSIDVRLYFQDFYGDSTNVMKMNVYELDTANVIEEGKNYYSNLNLKQFINPKRLEPLTQKVFTARDFIVDDAILDGSNYFDNVRIPLPKEYGSFILNKYYENPEYFKDSYSFIRHVCPGFYFSLGNGDGTMLYLNVSSLDIYFSYEENDSIYQGFTRFAATGEVIQSSSFDTQGAEAIKEQALNSAYTCVKSPFGLYTQLSLPVKEIYQGHENDSVNTVKITLNRYNETDQSIYAYDIPSNLLMVRKQDMFRFFEEKMETDNKTSFLASLNANQYIYANIGKLISLCEREKRSGMQSSGLSEADWEAQNPDWNKVVLIPVTTYTDQNTTTQKISHELRLTSLRLVGQQESIPVYVTYSKFAQ